MPARLRLTVPFLLGCVVVAATPLGIAAQTKPVDPSRRPDPYASPLSTIMSTRLWTDVPPAQDFVKETRPDAKTLDYAPLTGTDPDRPKPRDAAGVEALQAELENGGARNEARAKGLRDPAAPAVKRPARKSAAKSKPRAKNKQTASKAPPPPSE